MAGVVQLHAWELDTHSGDKMAEMMAARGSFPWEMTQLQHLQNQIAIQASYLREVIGSQRVDEVLPVFVAPQFTFTTQDNRPYDRGTVYRVLPYLEQISRTYPHVLWCPGTVWWRERVLDQRSIQYQVHDTTLLYQGGRLLLSLQKSLMSEIDPPGIASPMLWDQAHPDAAGITESRHNPFCEARIPGSQQAVSVGVEVARMHTASWDPESGSPSPYGALRTRYANGDRQDAGVDIHLLLGAATPLQPGNVAARDGGTVLRVDGAESASPRSQAGSVSRGDSEAATALDNWDPAITYEAATFTGDDPADRFAVFPPIAIR